MDCPLKGLSSVLTVLTMRQGVDIEEQVVLAPLKRTVHVTLKDSGSCDEDPLATLCAAATTAG
jgi:hypothetical protein